MGWYQGWRVRHQHPISFGLHLIGIPLTLGALALIVVQLIHSQWDLWWRPAILLAIGYVLQYVGHRIEGNTMGEVILLKKWQGKPYTAIAPQYQNRDLSKS